MLSPDLKQSVFNTIYLTFSHNSIAFAYLAGILISFVMLMIKPSRFATFILLSFIVLLFGYEYDKHIIAGFREQTLNSLATATSHQKVAKIVDIVIAQLLPIVFYFIGWISLFIGIIYAELIINKKEK